jgi:hypothetical protein
MEYGLEFVHLMFYSFASARIERTFPDIALRA